MCLQDLAESSVQKKMAAVHFNTIPCEPNRALSPHRKPYFGEFIPVLTKLCMQGLKFSAVFSAFLRVILGLVNE